MADKREEEPYRGAQRDLTDAAKMLSAAMGAVSGIPTTDAGAARAGQIKKDLPESHPPLDVHPIHTVIPRPPDAPLRIIIPAPKRKP